MCEESQPHNKYISRVKEERGGRYDASGEET